MVNLGRKWQLKRLTRSHLILILNIKHCQEMKTNFNKNSHFSKRNIWILWFLSGTGFPLKFLNFDSSTFYCTDTILQHSNEWNKIFLSVYCSGWYNQHILSFTNAVSSKRKVINHIKFQFRLIFFSLTFPLIINTNGNLHDIKFNACHKLNILNLQYINRTNKSPLASKRCLQTIPSPKYADFVWWMWIANLKHKTKTTTKICSFHFNWNVTHFVSTWDETREKKSIYAFDFFINIDFGLRKGKMVRLSNNNNGKTINKNSQSKRSRIEKNEIEKRKNSFEMNWTLNT